MHSSKQIYNLEPIAIVGAACRFPGPAYTLDGFWRLLAEGRDTVTSLPPERFSLDRFFSAEQNFAGRAYTTSAGVLPGITDFDPEFFGISRKEAMEMDPQQRLVLEMMWEALEQAHILPSSLRGSRTGVFVGAACSDWGLCNVDDPESSSAHSMTGSTLSIIANRISYFFDLHGPSMTIDTACSSSLVALHQACEALRSGEIPLALVGGINVLLAPYAFVGFSKAHMLSPDGRCKVFDASGNGYVRSEGGGVVVVMPLQRALEEGLEILALIAGSGVNSDGRTTGISLPNAKAQATLIRNVYTRFSLDPKKVVYVEAHGTGTAIGDPLEASAIGATLGKVLRGLRTLPVGSVKSSIGHLETASGMAGLLKALLVLRHNKIPPNLHLKTPNPAIDFVEENIAVPTVLMDLPKAKETRSKGTQAQNQAKKGSLVSVNSFGFGGTNAHVVLSLPDALRAKPTALPVSTGGALSPGQTQALAPFLLSARSSASLCSLAQQYATILEQIGPEQCYDLAANLAFSREMHDRRLVVTGSSLKDIRERLGKAAKSGQTGKTRAIQERAQATASGVFVFSGNGSQWPGMGKHLLDENRVFRETVEEVDDLLSPLQGWSIPEVLRHPEDYPDAFEDTEKSQPLIFAIQIGIVQVLKARGIVPGAVIGHSVGEAAASWAAGALSLADAALGIHVRSMLQAPLRGAGGMAVANTSVKTARELLASFPGDIDISAVNTETSISVAGDVKSLQSFVHMCKKRRIAAKMLPIPYPFHTHFMDAIQEELGGALASIQPVHPHRRFYSTVLGRSAGDTLLDVAYWQSNVRQPVLFAAAVKAAFADGFRLFLEIGPSPVLRSYMRDLLRGEIEPTFIAPTLSKSGNEAEDVESAWKNAWQHGWQLDVKSIFPHPHVRMELPLYPWNKEPCRREDTPECLGQLKAGRIHPLLGWQLPGAVPVFENTIALADFPWLADHKAGNGTPYPAAAIVESMLAAGQAVFPDKTISLERVELFRPLALIPESPKVMRLSIDPEDGRALLEARAHTSSEAWGSYARGRILSGYAPEDGSRGRDTDKISFSCGTPEAFGMAVPSSVLYKEAKRFSLAYGPAFRTVKNTWVRMNPDHPEALAELGISDPTGSRDTGSKGMHIAPPLLDGAFQTLFLLLGLQSAENGQACLPASFERVTLVAPGLPRFAHARLEKRGSRSLVASFLLLDEKGKVLLSLQRCRFQRAAWLERENVPSLPYVERYFQVAHPALPRQMDISVRALVKEVEAADIQWAGSQESPNAAGGNDQTQSCRLIQLTALAAALETVSSFADQSDSQQLFSCESLLQTGTLCPSQERWFRYLLERLANANLVVRQGDMWQIPVRDQRFKAEILWRTALSSAPGYAPEAALLAHVFCRRHDLLKGAFQDREEDILPPALADGYFSNAAPLQPLIQATQQIVRSVLQSAKPGQHIHVLQMLGDTAFSPLVTDLNPINCTWTVAAKNTSVAETDALTFSHIPALRFKSLDRTNPGKEHSERYQLILWLWSLHEHLDIALVLEQCQAMLAPGGILMVLEHAPDDFTDYIFGSRPSWWRASTQDDQPISLLQMSSLWRKDLEDAGFVDIETIGEKESSSSPAFLLLAKKSQVAPALPATPQIPAPVGATSEIPETCADRYWLVAGNQRGSSSAVLSELLAAGLRKQGEAVAVLLRGEEVNGHIFDPENSEHWRAELSGRTQDKKLQLVYLLGYDDRTDIPVDALADIQLTGASCLAALARAGNSLGPDAAIWVLAGGAMAAEIPEARPVPSQGALLGFTRVLINEMPSLHIHFVDLHGSVKSKAESVDGQPGWMDTLMWELSQPAPELDTDEPEVVLTHGGRYVPRLTRFSSAQHEQQGAGSAAKNSGAALAFDHPGRLRNLYWKESIPPQPLADEVCVAVSHTGLNFRDVMWTMGLLPEEALESGFSGPGLGMECSGVVTAVGSAVTQWTAGDEALCFAPSCFSTHVVTKASALARKPASISFAEGAALPVAFITAWYSLKHLARLQAGERLLIHGAAGGVGLAAVQIATHMGLEIYATAGAPEKHHFLHMLGVQRVFPSRSLDFARQILEATDGQGVDCVLNSLAGEAAAAGISLLRPFGKFIELGKRDFYADSPLRLRPFSRNLSYFGVDVDQLIIHQPDLARQLFNEIMTLFQERKFMPLPHTVYPSSRTTDAFQAMQQSSHIGKLVVDLHGVANDTVEPIKRWNLTPAVMEARANACYLVSGGNGGLGLASALHLAHRGAKHLLLLSRKGVTGEEEKQQLDSLRANGVQVIEIKVDVTNATQLEHSLKIHLDALPPLRGVIHAAAELDDGLISSLTPERIRRSLAAKTLGAWNLHQSTRALPLDFFVLYSSATTTFGNPGQGGYVAANSMLETLAVWRRSHGLPAQVIAWGAIGDTGMLTRNPKARDVLIKRLGVSPTSSADAVRWLEHCIATNTGASLFFGLDWESKATLPVLAGPRFSLLRPHRATVQTVDTSHLLENIRSASPQEGRRIITELLLEEIAQVLRLTKDKIPSDMPLAAQGMDSLMAVELALGVEQRFELTGYTLPLTEKTTAASLAESLYAILTGSSEQERAGEKQALSNQMLNSMERQHGVQLSPEDRALALENLQ
ncbi:MAG: SDR family NAD(P)-dependent oxidoreductase [Desulfovibrio sp.]|jgi:acyl transferase domain-containing protein/NADPH:quinone reductase-like Zn-dependent oxidoreductase/acyl carrier protein|nr:SDR family NAD(P)-dependent oxidoreductase [Desulfovibrio sp.]